MTISNDELDPELAAALAEDDADLPQSFETTDEEEAMDPDKRAALDEVRREIQQPRRKGRPKGSRNKRPAEEPVVQQMASASAPPPIKPRISPSDMEAIWESILQTMRDRGLGGPEMVTIGVTQISIGPNREEPKRMNSIPGEAVGGTRTRTPGEDLQDYIERGLHVPGGGGPAKYRLLFRLRGVARGGDANLGVAEVTLPSAADVRKRWEAVNQLQRDRERENDFGPMPRMSYTRGPTWEQTPHPLAGAAPQVSPQAPQMPSAAISQGMDPFAAQMFDRVWDMYERERRLAQRLGEAPPPAPDPRLYGPPPTAVAEGNLEERVARTVAETLKSLGILPRTANPVAAPLTAPVVAQAVTAPMNAAKEFFTQMREFKKMESEMREMFAPEEEEPPVITQPAVATVLAEPPEEDEYAVKPLNEAFARFEGDPIMGAKQRPDESTFQWLTRVAISNPKIAGKLLEKGAQMLDQSSFGKLVSAFTSMGGQQAQAARNLPGAVVDPGPQTNGSPTRPGFTPNIG